VAYKVIAPYTGAFMIIVITRDIFLFNAIKNLMNNEDVRLYNDISDIDLIDNNGLYIVVDSLYNNIFHTPLIRKLIFLFPEKIIFLSAFNIKLLFMGVDVIYANRKLELKEFVGMFKKKEISDSRLINISGKEHYVLTQVVKGRSNAQIASLMKVSVKTVNSHILRLKKVIGLDRICRITQTEEYNYLICQGEDV
jgi:LuxR family transcriptional regulator, dicarboxylate transport regulator